MSLQTFPVLPNDPAAIVEALGISGRPVLLYGAPGAGKSTLASKLAEAYDRQGISCACLGVDPGTPAFGLPGCVSLGTWQDGGWRLCDYSALCTLDAGRFRLPLILALQQLLPSAGTGPLLIDGPGVVRGVAGREMISALCQSLADPIVLAVAGEDDAIPLQDELRVHADTIWHVPSAAAARRPGARARARVRTECWDCWLADADSQTLDLEALPVLGTPPPRDAPEAWSGRQIALLRDRRTLTIGEIQHLDRRRLVVRVPPSFEAPDALLVRDARRLADGLLGSAEPFVSRQPVTTVPLPVPQPVRESPPLTGRCGPLDFTLVNGVFGDPLLHLRIRHAGRSLLFDLGDPGHLSARLAHQISDVFISHAHMDHLAGFQWLLRSRLGEFPVCRVYGPPGLARHIAGFLDSFLWDRIEDRGPVFEVAELHGERLLRWRLQAGVAGMQELEPVAARDGLLRDEPGFRIRAVELDHHTPVLAFAFEPRQELHVRRDRLEALRLEPGAWLGDLKQAILAEQPERMIVLPDGRQRPAGALAADLLLIQPGKRLVYATDLADSRENRQRLIPFARHAHTFFCESPFRIADSENARRNGHLTTRACGDIAAAAEVGLLVPFHVSRRYQHQLEEVVGEIRERFSALLLAVDLGGVDEVS